MMSLRKIRKQIGAVFPSVSYSLLDDSGCNCTWFPKCHIQSSWSYRSVCKITGLSFTNIYMPTAFFEIQTKTQPLSIMARTILVQARDPAKLSMEIDIAIDEGRLGDAWKLYEQHMQMEGFPRKTIANKLLSSFAESLDVQWLEKAYGLVERAIEESKQNLIEKEPLIYLSFALAKCSMPVLTSTVEMCAFNTLVEARGNMEVEGKEGCKEKKLISRH